METDAGGALLSAAATRRRSERCPRSPRKQDVVILDKLCHASLIDGARLSGATIRVFPHNHLGKLESHLEWAQREHPEARVVIVTESVFQHGWRPGAAA